MKTYTLDDVAVLIDRVNKYNDDIINFRTEENAADNLQIEKVEKALGLKFTSSYKSFWKKLWRRGKMKKILKLLSSMALLSTAGCQLGNPPPSTLVLWEKPRADRAVIEQSLLKCGWKPVYASSSDMNSYASEFASVYECMKKAGFRYKLQDSKGIYFTQPPKSASFLTDLIIAGYQQFMDNDTFGLSNTSKKERAMITHFENERKRQQTKKSLQKRSSKHPTHS